MLVARGTRLWLVMRGVRVRVSVRVRWRRSCLDRLEEFGPPVGLEPWTQPRRVALKERGEATMVHPPSRAGGIRMVGWSPVQRRYSRRPYLPQV